jgi:hypothetical protein
VKIGGGGKVRDETKSMVRRSEEVGRMREKRNMRPK